MTPAEQAALTDEQILEIHNRCIEAQQASRDSFEWVALEIPPGTPQVKRDRRTGLVLPRGDVLRCHITDCGAGEEDPVAIYIDDEDTRCGSSARCSRRTQAGTCASCSCPRTPCTRSRSSRCASRSEDGEDGRRASDDDGGLMGIEGKWRITEMELWDREAIDLLGPAFVEFEGEGGCFRFIAVDGWMSCEHGQRRGRPHVAFTWEGNDECDPASGRGWATLRKDGTLAGRIYIHHGDDSGFTAIPFTNKDEPRAPIRRTRRRPW
jgi:hypothetical protein